MGKTTKQLEELLQTQVVSAYEKRSTDKSKTDRHYQVCLLDTINRTGHQVLHCYDLRKEQLPLIKTRFLGKFWNHFFIENFRVFGLLHDEKNVFFI